MAGEEMRIFELVFWIFAGGVVLWIAGIWISMLVPRRSRTSGSRAAPAGGSGGYADTGYSSNLMPGGDDCSDSDGAGDCGGDSGGSD